MEWLDINKLSLNIQKTVYLNFGGYCASIGNNDFQQQRNFKYLGIFYDSHLNWDKHVESFLNKSKYLPLLIYNLTEIVNSDTLGTIYFAFFHSLINCGNIAWDDIYSGCRNIMQKLQNRILKIANKNKFVDRNNPFNLEKLFTYNSIFHHYEELKESITRRKIIQIQIKKTISSKCTYLTTSKLFNELPNELNALKTYKRKETSKEWILSNI